MVAGAKSKLADGNHLMSEMVLDPRRWFCGHMRYYIVNLSPVAIFLVISTNFGHMMVIWWNRVSWLYLWSYEIGVGENGSLVR